MDNNFQKQKILIVDDEPNNIRMLVETLKEDYQLIVATSGSEAIECAASEDPPDLILLDIIMPNMDGYEVCERLKTDRKTCGIPVVFITAMGEDGSEARGFESGAVDYITKPFTPAKVNARVRTHLELKRHRDHLERTLHESTEKLSDSARKLRAESSERMRAEEDRKRLMAAIEQAAEIFIITDPKGNILYVNPAFEHHTGYSREESLGQNIMILERGGYKGTGKGGKSVSYKNIWKNIRQGNTWRGVFTHKRKDGMLYKAESAISPVFDKTGKLVNFVCVSRDVTREVELEAQLRQSQKLEAIGTLAGGIAHDFNNILFAIMGYTELAMANLPPDSEISRYLRRVDEAGRRATELIEQILAFGRKTDLEQHPVRVQIVLREVSKLLRGTLPSTIKIHQSIDNKCSPIMAASAQIHQVIMNLCTNAYHAMRDHGGVLELKLAETEINAEQAAMYSDLAPGPHVRLTVSDTGHGMDEAVMAKIFDPYFTTKKIGEGTGLDAFSMVYGIVQEHRGAISVHSESGRGGTTFHIFFPVHRADSAPCHKEQFKHEPPKGSGRILVVDDEEPIAQLLEMKLKNLGYEVKAYTASTEALKSFSDAPEDFDLIITDMTMPNLTSVRSPENCFRSVLMFPLCFAADSEISSQRSRPKGPGVLEYF